MISVNFAVKRFSPPDLPMDLISPRGDQLLTRAAKALNLLHPARSLSECFDQMYLSKVVVPLFDGQNQQIPGDEPGSWPTEPETSRLYTQALNSFRADLDATRELVQKFALRVVALNRVTAKEGCLFEFAPTGTGQRARVELQRQYEGEALGEADLALVARCAGRLPLVGSGPVSPPMEVLYRAVCLNSAYAEMIRFRHNMWAMHHESWYSRDDAFEELLRREIRFKMNDVTSMLSDHLPEMERNFSRWAKEDADRQHKRALRQATRKQKLVELDNARERREADKSRLSELKAQFVSSKPQVEYRYDDGFLVTGNNGPVRVHHAGCRTVVAQRKEAEAAHTGNRRYPALMDEAGVRRLKSFQTCAVCKPTFEGLAP
jgi:hypothetical protein